MTTRVMVGSRVHMQASLAGSGLNVVLVESREHEERAESFREFDVWKLRSDLASSALRVREKWKLKSSIFGQDQLGWL